MVLTRVINAETMRKRRQRARAKAGLRPHLLYLHEASIQQALAIREGLPTDLPLDPEFVDQLLTEMIGVWVERWIRLGHE